MKNRAAGFTLIELMVTIAVAAVLTAMAVPSFTRFAVSSRLVNHTNDLIGNLNIARSEAIRRNRNISLCRAASDVVTTCAGTNGAWQFWIVRDDADGAIIRRGSFNTYGGTMGVTSDLPNQRVVFGSDGLARTTAGVLVSNQSFTVCSTRLSTENKRQLSLGAGSRVTTKKGDGAC